MRVGLEATVALAHRFTGVQRYVLELSRALLALGNEELHCWLLLRVADYRKRRLLPPMPWPIRWYWSGVRRFDVIHGLDVRLPRVRAGVPQIATIHDLSPFSLPNFSSERTRRNMLDRYHYAARHAERIVAISNATKLDFASYLSFPPERIDVVYHGLSPAFEGEIGVGSIPGPRAGAPYFVAFGGNPRKNLPRTIRALAASSRHDAELRVVGAPDSDCLQALSETKLEARVRFESNLDEPGMVSLYKGSSGLLYPSLLEGFGLPILEGMASGIPVLTSFGGGGEEIARGHAILVEPLSIDSIAAGIDRLSAVTESHLEAAARHARTFTWRHAAEQTLAVYRSV